MAKTPKKDAPKPLRTKIILPDPAPTMGLLGYPLPAKLQEENRRKWEADIERVASKKLEKLRLLAEFLGVDTRIPEWQTRLCLVLAEEKYPGFRVVTKHVRSPKKWDVPANLRFLCDIEKTKREIRATRSGIVTNTHALTVMVRRCVAAKKGSYLPSRGQSEAAWIKTLENRVAEITNSDNDPTFALLLGSEAKDEALRDWMFDRLIPEFSSPN